MKTHWNTQISFGEFVTDNALCAETFENLSIDFCCGGDNTPEKVCKEKGLEPEGVLSQLKLLENSEIDQGAYID